MIGYLRSVFLGLLLVAGSASAQDSLLKGGTCPDSGFLGPGFFQNVCWTCIFPLRVAGLPLGPNSGAAAFPGSENTGMQLKDIFGAGTSNRLPDKVAGPLCLCPGKTMGIPALGITWGWWEPSHFIEVVRKPYCSPVLGGTTLLSDTGSIGGDGNTDLANGVNLMKSIRQGGPNRTTSDESSGLGQSFYHYHWLKSPYGYVSDWIQSGMCNGNSGGDFDFLWFSEIDPVWTNPALANLTHPESILFSNPVAVTACMADSVTSTIGKPMNSLFWCGGTWGAIYPHVGHLGYKGSPPREASLMATRMMAQLHRRGMMKQQFGDKSVCKAKANYMLPKQGYRLQMFSPMRETRNNHWIGASTFRWGEWRNIPYSGEDFVWLNWAWSDCCMTMW